MSFQLTLLSTTFSLKSAAPRVGRRGQSLQAPSWRTRLRKHLLRNQATLLQALIQSLRSRSWIRWRLRSSQLRLPNLRIRALTALPRPRLPAKMTRNWGAPTRTCSGTDNPRFAIFINLTFIINETSPRTDKVIIWQ